MVNFKKLQKIYFALRGEGGEGGGRGGHLAKLIRSIYKQVVGMEQTVGDSIDNLKLLSRKINSYQVNKNYEPHHSSVMMLWPPVLMSDIINFNHT
jgi:hypothetical protein